MADTDAWTIGRLLTWTTDYLRQQGSDSPRLDAEVLLAAVRGCPRIALYTSFDEVADETVRKAFRDLVRRRAEGMPVAYLVGYKEFYSLKFKVTPDVLIPRPETELLVVELLDRLKQRQSLPDLAGSQPARIVDVGTGSGIIAICAARHAPQCHVTAIDISPSALAVAAANVRQHGVEAQIDLREGDLLACLPAEPKFDIVVSNPPYVTTAEMQELPRDVKDFEPHLALAAGERGTDVIARLVPQAAERLAAGGTLLLEISPMIDNDVRQLVAADGRFDLEPTKKDLAGHPRVVQAKRRV
jgi:release factor glutamine methyltransferase